MVFIVILEKKGYFCWLLNLYHYKNNEKSYRNWKCADRYAH